MACILNCKKKSDQHHVGQKLKIIIQINTVTYYSNKRLKLFRTPIHFPFEMASFLLVVFSVVKAG